MFKTRLVRQLTPPLQKAGHEYFLVTKKTFDPQGTKKRNRGATSFLVARKKIAGFIIFELKS